MFLLFLHHKAMVGDGVKAKVARLRSSPDPPDKILSTLFTRTSHANYAAMIPAVVIFP